MMSNQGHWVGLKADTANNFGFIYIIRDLTTGQSYIGKKQFWAKKPRALKCKTAVADKGSPKWKSRCWHDSGWRKYKGSSNHLNLHFKEFPNHEFEFEIIKLCRSRGILTYSEVQEQWRRDVLGSKLPDGSWKYFNRAIGAVKFRPPVGYTMSDKHKAKIGESRVGLKYSAKSKAKISKSLTGKKHTKEQKAARSAAATGEGNHRFGVDVSEETKAKIGEANRDSEEYTFYCSTSNTYFTGLRSAFIKRYGLDNSSVGRLISGKQKSTKGWILYG